MKRNNKQKKSGAAFTAVILCIFILMGVLTGCNNTKSETTAAPIAETTAEALAETTAEPSEEEAEEAEEDEEEASEEDYQIAAEDIIHYPDPAVKENLPEKKPELREDIYLNINWDEIMETELPVGMPNYTAFSKLADLTEEQTKELLSGTISADHNTAMAQTLYRMYMDLDARNATGFDGVSPFIEKVKAADSIPALLELYLEDEVSLIMSPFLLMSAMADARDANVNTLHFYVPTVFLDDPAEYREMTDMGELYKAADDVFFKDILLQYGFSEAEADKIIEDEFAYETKVAGFLFDTEVSYREDYTELTTNYYSKAELIELMGGFPIERMMKLRGVDTVDTIIIDEPEYYRNLQNLLCEENLEGLKADIIISLLADYAAVGSEEAFAAYSTWNNTKSGIDGTKAIDRLAYDHVCGHLSEIVGDMYSSAYFSEEERENVEAILENLMKALHKRLESADWMSAETRNTAIEKLDSIRPYIGYPDSTYYDYSRMNIDPEKSLYENLINLNVSFTQQDMEFVGQPVNQEAWGIMMPANVVNACYIPSSNSICFPAAILQEPFYSKDYSESMNYGAIGVVMGHELTHAFDTTGSQYDKSGNLANWWTTEDREAFTKLTHAVGERYASYAMIGDERVKGDLTIGETVADLGGMAASLDALNALAAGGKAVNYEDFFTAQARIWFVIRTKENAIMRLRNDPHAPATLRVNVNMTQFPEFYEAFGVKEGDPMYTAPEKRLKVW